MFEQRNVRHVYCDYVVMKKYLTPLILFQFTQFAILSRKRAFKYVFDHRLNENKLKFN